MIVNFRKHYRILSYQLISFTWLRSFWISLRRLELIKTSNQYHIITSLDISSLMLLQLFQACATNTKKHWNSTHWKYWESFMYRDLHNHCNCFCIVLSRSTPRKDKTIWRVLLLWFSMLSIQVTSWPVFGWRSVLCNNVLMMQKDALLHGSFKKNLIPNHIILNTYLHSIGSLK